jgi:2-C-methyl-D-erythritol 4-phosphate cytidylyltransferase / 2-C-methyl-D-erythritol 2,4-cyclodiphosphate synthase
VGGSACIIVAAGRGRRFGGPVPKQYRALGGEAVLRRTVRAVASHPAIAHLRVVINADDRDLYEVAVAGLDLAPPVIGGETRQDSVRHGLESLLAADPDRVLIHDGVRPFVAAETIGAVLAALDAHEAALACVPVPDTLKRATGGVVEATIDRTGIWRAQTPQGFRYADILAAHRAAVDDPALADLTDDTQLIERRGGTVAVVAGHEDNFKITTEPDLARAERLLALLG